jgi:hypothetical protein
MDASKKSAEFIRWNVVSAENDGKTWTMKLVGREKEWIGRVRIRKMTLSELQEKWLSQKMDANEACAWTIVNTEACYMTEVETEDASKEGIAAYMKNFESLKTSEMYFILQRQLQKARAEYEEWSGMPQMPLEDPITSPKCYYELPAIVYMHLVGQLCTVI